MTPQLLSKVEQIGGADEKILMLLSGCLVLCWLAFLSRREALTPIGAVEVLGDFDLAAGPHV